jgi:CHAD domain-containing protein
VGLKEKYHIGAVDWAVIDASGTPEQALNRKPNAGRSRSGLHTPAAETAMLYQKSTNKVASRAEREGQRPSPLLSPMMACDTAFRVIARRYLNELTANYEATCQGETDGLHKMRIALTRLRIAILFFSPMVADSKRTQIRSELKWLNAHLGVVRDLDVVIERFEADGRQAEAIPFYRSWSENRAERHRRLTRALRSVRYRRLLESTSDWIENGPWSIEKNKAAIKQRACLIATYGTAKLSRWQKKLLKRSRKLLKMGAEKRHRLRLLNKKLTYSIEAFEDLFSDKRFSGQQAGLKRLRKAQRSLGHLNDDARGHSLSIRLQGKTVPAPLQFLSRKSKKHLLRNTTAAYGKLAALWK